MIFKRKDLSSLHVPHNKNTAGCVPTQMTCPKEVLLPMNMHSGAPAVPVVEVGDHVRVGQLIAREDGNISAPVHATISGTVAADATYEQDGKTVFIHDIDRASTVLVVLQKKVGDVYNDIEAVEVSLSYETDEQEVALVGLGQYEFTNLPNDGTEYRVHLLVNNYNESYDNDQNGTYSEEEAVALIDALTVNAKVDIHLDFEADSYLQEIRVDASQIHPDLRPTGVLAQILYRDLGDVHHYQIISQHTVEPYGIKMKFDDNSDVVTCEW